MATVKAPIIDNIMKAGIDAIAAFTMKTTIDKNGILTSTIVTRVVSLLFSTYFSIICKMF